MKDLKIVFMGTPEFSLNILKSLMDNYDVKLVVTQPDKEVGRKKVLTMPPVKVLALDNNIEVFQPVNIKEDYQKIIDIKPDLIVTCAYGQIIPKVLLDLPKYGCINVHASLLPKLRGGAPIHKSIILGYEKTGVTIMYMDVKMDAGDIISQVETRIDDGDTLGTLHDRLSILGSELLIATIPKIINNSISRIPQDINEVTYAWNITRDEEKIDFSKTSREIFNQVRGLNPAPAAFTVLDGKIYKIYNTRIVNNDDDEIPGTIVNIYKDGIGVKTDDGEIVILELKPDGKNKMSANSFLNGIDKSMLLGKKFE